MEHRSRDRPDDGVRDDVGRIGKAIEKVAAFEIRAECVDDVFVRRPIRQDGRFKSRGLRAVFQADHRPQRAVRFSRLELIAGRGGVRPKVEHRNARNDREDAAVAPQNGVPDLVVLAPMEHRRHELESAAAVRTPQDVEQ